MNLYNFHQSSTYTSYPFVIRIPFVGRGHLGAPLQGLGQKPSSPVGILFWGVGTLHSSRLGPQLKQFSKRVAGRFCDLFENDFAVAPLHPNLIQPWHVFTHQSIKAGFGMSQETALQLFFDMTRRFVRPSETWQREKNGRFSALRKMTIATSTDALFGGRLMTFYFLWQCKESPTDFGNGTHVGSIPPANFYHFKVKRDHRMFVGN